jgi:glutamate-ammonia-ligase adenylyltransferase
MDALRPPETIPESELAEMGLADPARAKRLLLALAGQGVTDDIVAALFPSLFEALRRSPDPDRALNNFARWTEAVTSRYTHFQYLLSHPVALDIFFNVCGVSQFFSDILIRNPEYFEILANPGVRGGSKSAGALYRELSAFVDNIRRTELKLEAMRRFKQREILRIGTRDILELADLATTALEFSNLADACVQKAYEIGVAQLAERYPLSNFGFSILDLSSSTQNPQSKIQNVFCPVPFAVIGMGKLGGQELNYSSDIDLMFVCADEVIPATHDSPPLARGQALTTPEYSHKLAEFIVNALSKNTQNGHLFRVDMRLRPEGRFGALVRTLSSYRTYYESWAEPWEQQALLKARPVAGDTRLGDAFQAMITPFVYRRSVTSDFVGAIRRNKERIEKKAELEGKGRTDVKVGMGGIRDIEFTVQLLQLERGSRDPLLRTPNTLQAIARLRHAGALTAQEAEELAEDYVFLRTVEHRLQILYERQTQSLPADPAERRLLARRLGYNEQDSRPRANADAAAFDADYSRRTGRVRGHCERLFYGARREEAEPSDIWRDLLMNVEMPQARAVILANLREAGFHDPERAYADLKTAAFGGDYGLAHPESKQVFMDLAARLVNACSHTGDPDAALQGVETVALAAPNPAQMYRTLAEGEGVLERLCRLAAGSPPLTQSLARHLEWMDMLVSEEIIDPAAKTADQSRAELEERGLLADPSSLKDGVGGDDFWNGLALYMQRERLRIGARDLWGEVSPMTTALELSGLADAVIGALLANAARAVARRFPDPAVHAVLETVAVIGLGKLGGSELGYGSDWDILIAYEDTGNQIENPKSKIQNSNRPTPFAAVNALAETLLAAGQELRTRGAPVELDARLRPEGRFGALARTVNEYRDYYLHSAQTWERQVLTKARPVAGSAQTARAYMRATHEAIYSAPLSAAAQEEILHMKRRMENERLKVNERHSDIKLGHGGMSDIEFTAQLWQMRVGARFPQARVPGTVAALHALGGVGAIPAPDAARLAETYALWTAIRGRLALPGGIPTDTLPSDSLRLRALAVGLGAADAGGRMAEEIFREQFTAHIVEIRAIVERLFYGTPLAR